MKKLILSVLLLAGMSLGGTGRIGEDCSFNGKKLYGKVKIVSYGEDFKILPAGYGEDLRVETVGYGAGSCGKWEIVTYGEDFKIRFVEYGEDFKIRFVSYNPGL